MAYDEGRARLWLRSLDATTAQPLAGTEGAIYPFWSPDSSALGFFADGKLKRIDISGGLPQTLATAPGGRGGTWNPDGVIVFAPTADGSLTSVPSKGGDVSALTQRRSTAPGRAPISSVPSRWTNVPLFRPGFAGHAGYLPGNAGLPADPASDRGRYRWRLSATGLAAVPAPGHPGRAAFQHDARENSRVIRSPWPTPWVSKLQPPSAHFLSHATASWPIGPAEPARGN